MKLGLYDNIRPEMGLKSDVKLDRLSNYAMSNYTDFTVFEFRSPTRRRDISRMKTRYIH